MKCAFRIAFWITILYAIGGLIVLLLTFGDNDHFADQKWNYNLFCLFCSIIVLAVTIMRMDEVPCFGLEVMLLTTSFCLIVLGIFFISENEANIHIEIYYYYSILYYFFIALIEILAIVKYCCYKDSNSVVQYGNYGSYIDEQESP